MEKIFDEEYVLLLDKIEFAHDRSFDSDRIGFINKSVIKGWKDNIIMRCTDVGLTITKNDISQYMRKHNIKAPSHVINEYHSIYGHPQIITNNFTIAKNRSSKQEKYWKSKLNVKYGCGKEFGKVWEQYPIGNCRPDFVLISDNSVIVWEVKLNEKDIKWEQYNNFIEQFSQYKYVTIKYLIGYNTIYDMNYLNKYTTSGTSYPWTSFNLFGYYNKPAKYYTLPTLTSYKYDDAYL